MCVCTVSVFLRVCVYVSHMASVKCQLLPPPTHVVHKKTHRKLLKPGSRIWVTTLTSPFRNACKHTHTHAAFTHTDPTQHVEVKCENVTKAPANTIMK